MTKDLVLEKLTELKNTQTAISGEELAKTCGVSRAAIWKAVDSLRKDGFIIKGTPNGGYLLEEKEDFVTAPLFYNYIRENFPDNSELQEIEVECFKEIDSTNLYAKKLLLEKAGLNKKVIIAESQSKGRGRLGRAFYSPQKSGIYLSAIYSPKEAITDPAKITVFSAVAICRALKKLYGIQAEIKWINDIFYKNKKIGGILTEGFSNFESQVIESAIIGIGINIEENAAAFPEEVQQVAGAIFSAENENHISRCELAAEISAQLYMIMKENAQNVFQEYKKLSFLIGKKLKVYPVIGDEEKAYFAKAIDIDENACLVVETEDGSQKKLFSGEVTLKSANITRKMN